jgi:hypothetical protein
MQCRGPEFVSLDGPEFVARGAWARINGTHFNQKHKCAAIGKRTYKPFRALFHYCRAVFKSLLNLRVQLLF